MKSNIDYNAALERIEELLLVVNEDTPKSDPNSIELVELSNFVADYENIHHPICRS